jgi:hypothetical protein
MHCSRHEGRLLLLLLLLLRTGQPAPLQGMVAVMQPPAEHTYSVVGECDIDGPVVQHTSASAGVKGIK